jgi:xylulose-5-phosphate/fructose-6-phosphate phosphoketolase
LSTEASSATTDQLALYRRATNYIAAAMIYLQGNHMLDEPIEPDHVKHRLLGHWGTVPGLNLIYAGLNRLILDTDASMLLVTGPGHGAPANLANLWIDGCLEDVRPELSRDREGLGQLIRSFSWPGGFPSHIAPIVPGTIHEGGELGYALATAFGAALDNPELIVACIVGDGEAETGPTAGAWHSNKFLDPVDCGAVLPILHVNGYKIANPTVYGTMSDEELTKLFEGFGWHPMIVAGDDLDATLASALDQAHGEIRELQSQARAGRRPERPQWPMIVLRSPKGWTGIRELDGIQIEGTSKAHQVPAMQARTNPVHLEALEQWLRSYHPEELFDERGGPRPEVLAMCPTGDKRMGANPHVNGGHLRVPLQLPSLEEHAVEVSAPGAAVDSALGTLGKYLADVFRLNDEQRNFRIVCPDEVASNRLNAVFEVENHAYEWPVDRDISPDYVPGGRIMEVLSEHNCQGWLQGYVLTGRHGIFAVFGAPLELPDHADRAVGAAREMLEVRLPRFNAWLREEGLSEGVRMGIGLNSGHVMSGHVGSERRVEYAAVGDTTNTASRIESLTKGTPHQLFLSDSTREALRSPPDDLIEVGETEIRGRQGHIKLWSIREGPKPEEAADIAEPEPLPAPGPAM